MKNLYLELTRSPKRINAVGTEKTDLAFSLDLSFLYILFILQP